MRIKTHPGGILDREFMKPLGLSARKLGEAIDVPQNRISDIIRERRNVTADTAIRLGRYFGTTARFWINLQTAHDLSLAESQTDYSDIEQRPMESA